MLPSGIYDVVYHPYNLWNIFIQCIYRLSHIPECSMHSKLQNKLQYTYHMSRSVKFCCFEFFRFKTISIKDLTSFSYLDFRNELHSSRPLKWYITLASWVFIYRFGKMGQKNSVGKGLSMFFLLPRLTPPNFRISQFAYAMNEPLVLKDMTHNDLKVFFNEC